MTAEVITPDFNTAEVDINRTVADVNIADDSKF